MVYEWLGCNVAWTKIQGRLETLAAVGGLLNTAVMRMGLQGQERQLLHPSKSHVG